MVILVLLAGSTSLARRGRCCVRVDVEGSPRSAARREERAGYRQGGKRERRAYVVRTIGRFALEPRALPRWSARVRRGAEHGTLGRMVVLPLISCVAHAAQRLDGETSAKWTSRSRIVLHLAGGVRTPPWTAPAPIRQPHRRGLVLTRGGADYLPKDRSLHDLLHAGNAGRPPTRRPRRSPWAILRVRPGHSWSDRAQLDQGPRTSASNFARVSS